MSLNALILVIQSKLLATRHGFA